MAARTGHCAFPGAFPWSCVTSGCRIRLRGPIFPAFGDDLHDRRIIVDTYLLFPWICVHDDDFRPADRISNHRSPIARDCGSAWTKTPSIRGNLAHDDEAAPACSTRRRLFPPRLHPVHAGVQHRGIVRRKWIMRRIRVTIAAHSLRISRILRVNSAWLGGGWCGSGRSGRDRYYW